MPFEQKNVTVVYEAQYFLHFHKMDHTRISKCDALVFETYVSS